MELIHSANAQRVPSRGSGRLMSGAYDEEVVAATRREFDRIDKDKSGFSPGLRSFRNRFVPHSGVPRSPKISKILGVSYHPLPRVTSKVQSSDILDLRWTFADILIIMYLYNIMY